MTLTQVWGALILFVVGPLVGGLPLISWIVQGMTGRRLERLGTGNVSVSAAFYHGGRTAGIFAVLSEAAKGIAMVLLARTFFPIDPEWELIALLALVMGRYWFGRGAGTTNVVWGYAVHDPIAAALVLLIGGISFTVLRERRQGRFSILVLFPLITALRHPQQSALIAAAIMLAGVLGWIYMKLPDDLDLDSQTVQTSSRSMFRFFQGDRGVHTLDDRLDAGKVGQKAATLSQLKRLGYPVPPGWVLLPGDDPEPLVALLDPSPELPLVVRSSAIGEDSETASAAGQYETVLNVTRREELLPAIARCLESYDTSAAAQYRRDRGSPEASMCVLIQPQIQGVFSGVAFSRDPMARQGDAVVIEGLPGSAAQVVSGQVTPDSYRVFVRESAIGKSDDRAAWLLADDETLEVEGSGDLPPRLVQQVAFLARQLEQYYHGMPQDVEWSFDGQTLWLLQTRPITTLLPLWTRKIAAEVIPDLIRPLTWSINRPLTCGVWGDIFTIVLDDRAAGLDFNDTATLHYSRAYFNATLLGQIFRRMGLPPESLEFLTRGAKFSKPPLRSTLQNLPGLLRLVQRERRLETDFQRDYDKWFAPVLNNLAQFPTRDLEFPALMARIDVTLDSLTMATYYSILAPLSAALRKAIFRVPDQQLDNQATPEIGALRALQDLARSAHDLLQQTERAQPPTTPAELFDALAASPAGLTILNQFNQVLDRYGYLSEVGTDIAVPTWREDPQPVRELFTQFCLNLPPASVPPRPAFPAVQRRITLKGRVTEVYSRLLAELRWSFVALEAIWLESGLLEQPGD
ncbi:glycerol-3-phosphate acyltransferase, partial [Leptolyngbya sp. FACHB-36]|uniref:glycerol-3-phosphate acyltransferase n=1 Tax=Leptolyngbya sp. FACHB-36 TaxID=2692808 RepID=UPI00168130AB